MQAVPAITGLMIVAVVFVGLLAAVVMIAMMLGKKAGPGFGILAALLMLGGLMLFGLFFIAVPTVTHEAAVRHELATRLHEQRSIAEAHRMAAEAAASDSANHGHGTVVDAPASADFAAPDAASAHDAHVDDAHVDDSHGVEAPGEDTHGDDGHGESAHTTVSDASHDQAVTHATGKEVAASDTASSSQSADWVDPYDDYDGSLFDEEPTKAAWQYLKEGDKFQAMTSYSNKVIAAKGLAAKTAEELLVQWEDKHPGTNLEKVFVKFDYRYGKFAGSTFLKQLKNEISPVDVEETAGTNVPEAAVWLRVRYIEGAPHHVTTDELGYQTNTGSLEVLVKNLDGASEQPFTSAQYEEPSWLWGSSTSRNGHFVARSGLCAERELALREANLAAINRLQSKLEEYDRRSHVSYFDWKEVRKALYKQLRNQRYVKDVFAQELKSPEGLRVWRAAVLIEPEEQHIASVVDKLSMQRAHQQQQTQKVRVRNVRTGIGIFGFFVVLTGLYFAVNTLTKGYYSSALLVGGAILALMMLALGFFYFMRAKGVPAPLMPSASVESVVH